MPRAPLVRPPRRASAGWVAFAVFALLTFFALWDYTPPLPARQDWQLQFDAITPGASDPIAVAGVTGEADFLFVRYVSATSAVFGYERWGSKSTLSAPVEIQPGKRYRVQIVLPILQLVPGVSRRAPDEVRVVFEGREILKVPVELRYRSANKVWLGQNPVGGSACGPEFHGRILRTDGVELRGNPREFLTRGDRNDGWFLYNTWQLALILVVSALAGLAVRRQGWPSAAGARRWVRQVGSLWREHRAFAITAALCLAGFAWFVTCGSFRLIYADSFGLFFDYQATGLLQGRLDVPIEALSGEAFVVGGRIFGYFGLLPAVQRLPFAIFHVGFGQLTRLMMLADFSLCLLGSYLILREIMRLAGRSDGRVSAVAVALFVTSAGLGTPLLFLGSRAYIYHEADICGAAMALLAVYATLRYLAAPNSRWSAISILFGLLAVQARPSVGLFALTLAPAATAMIVWRARKSAIPQLARQAALILVASSAAVGTFNLVSYLKFGTFDGSPLRYSVQYTPERLAKFHGENFHLENIPFNADAYLVLPNYDLTRHFPYFYFGPRHPRGFDGYNDLAEPTLAMPWSMPAIFALATLGCAGAWFGVRALRPAILTVGLALLPMSLALLCAIVISQRYLSDFCPGLIALAAAGIAGIELSPGGWRAGLRSLAGLLAVASVAITIALSLHFQGESVWGVPDEARARYQTWRREIDQFTGATPRPGNPSGR